MERKKRNLHGIWKTRWSAVIFSLIFVILWSVRMVAGAQESVTGSLTVTCPVEDMKLSVYHVADLGNEGKYVLSGNFAEYTVSMDQQSHEGWQEAADTLADYAKRDGIEPDASGQSGTDGQISFADLREGLYLVVGDTVQRTEDGVVQIYTPQVSLIMVPDYESQDNRYEISAILKYDKTPEDKKTNPPVSQDGKSDKNNKENSTGKMLPQTGQLWWPVPLLLLMGIVTLAVGKSMIRRNLQ